MHAVSGNLTLIAALRRSRWLAVAVLFALLLRIGSVAACTQHELADLGMAPEGVTIVEKASAGSGADGLLAHAASCTHCSCHHAAAVLQSVAGMTIAVHGDGVEGRVDERASAHVPLTLRPPIG
ncbi:hypothetical protein [Noviluteimonas gilva]|uniref:DUF2946 domain-containing protein n=1 Tax=Noviluteimonas gilva TaxID=2682097 RepID=A0A7C9HNH3_9GAMM|nr:hypothetical protein [Lysobacter gilvus]MUV15152.1 hypothetical protein [Lysobacter gilvus]